MASITGSLSNDEYRRVKAYSKSDLDLIHKSAALLDWARNCQTDGSEAVERGTTLHCATLEPDVFAATYSRMPDYDLRTASGRANAESFRESMASSGRIILEAKQYDLVNAMRDSIMAHPTARAFLESEGRAEHSIFWEIDGIKLKCRPDWIPDVEKFGHVLVDVKKVGDIDHLQRSISQFRYNVQAAFYSDAYHQLTGNHPRFIFIAVGERRSIGRHPVRVFELPVDWTDDGRSSYQADLEVVKEMREFGCGLDVEVLQRPRWDK